MRDEATDHPLQSAPSGDAHTPVRRRHRESRRGTAAVDPGSVADTREKLPNVKRPSWRDIPVSDLSGLQYVLDNMPLVMRTVFELAELDPSLFRPDERLRLRLLVDRVIGATSTDAVGEAIRDIYTLRRRGFPVSAISETPPPRKGREEARRVIQTLRTTWNRSVPGTIAESLWVEKTLDFLEQRSRH
ncbi:hypothetical protein GCM10009552_28570 [Rothia nasimurium]